MQAVLRAMSVDLLQGKQAAVPAVASFLTAYSLSNYVLRKQEEHIAEASISSQSQLLQEHIEGHRRLQELKRSKEAGILLDVLTSSTRISWGAWIARENVSVLSY